MGRSAIWLPLSVCMLFAGAPPLWAASAAVTSGVKVQINSHSRFDAQCRPIRVDIRILAAPANGTLTSEPKQIVIPAQNALGESQPAQCVGRSIEGVAVFYQSKPGFVGNDSFRYLRVNPNDAKDRFNGELSYTVTVAANPASADKAAPPSSAAATQPSVQTMFEKYNLLGTFAWDCSKPPAKDNVYFVNRAIDADHVQRDQMSGPATRDSVTVIDKAAALGPTEIAVSGTRDGHPAEAVWRVEQNRQSAIDVTIDGKKVFSGGRNVANGQEARWLIKCR